MGLELVVFAASVALDSSIIASLQSIVANSTCYLPTEHSFMTVPGSETTASVLSGTLNCLVNNTVAGVWLPGGASHLFKSTKRHENTTC